MKGGAILEVYERIKYLRKNELKCTQEAFAKKIKISRSNLGSIETGRINVTDRVIYDICSVYGVNDLWLRTGQGEIMEKMSPDEEMALIIGQICNENDSFKLSFLRMVARIIQDDNCYSIIKSELRSLIFNERL